MKQLDYLTHRRKLLTYFGLGLTGAVLKGCSLPSTIETSNTKPIVNATPETTAETTTTIARNTSGKSLPEFTGVQEWLNSPPLTIADLKGQVVLIHIWTFACINCQRTLPYVVKWHEQYAKQGLRVIGIHTPEFPFERDVNQIKSALSKHRITYPNAIDNGHKMWSAYNNEYWPHLFLADRRGIIQYDHNGEPRHDGCQA